REVARKETGRPFNLERGPVWRAALLHLDSEDHVLLLCFHHVASDGWSVGILIKEFTTFYEGYRQGRSLGLPELPVQYADFSCWQREWFQGEVLQRQIDYWRNQLSKAPRFAFPNGSPRTHVSRRSAAGVPFFLSADKTRALKELSRNHGVTLFMTLLSAF